MKTQMSRTIRVTILVENTAGGRDLLGEHGLSFWIEAGPKRVLLDTGQGNVLLGNARKLGVGLELVDVIVLSHGHYDHTGGLRDALRAERRTKVYAHPAAFRPKYARNMNGTARDIGMPFLDETKIRERADELIWTNRPTEIWDGLFVTGEIPRVTDFEDTGGAFFLDEQCQEPDPLIDDQAMFFEATGGTVVLLGCAHAGVINTLAYVRQLTNNRPIHAVMGGMHLVNASPERISRTIEALQCLNIVHLIPAHCTGAAAVTKLQKAFPRQCRSGTVGTTMEFERS